MRDYPKLRGHFKYFEMDRDELMVNSMEVSKTSTLSPIREEEYKTYNFDSKLT